MLSENNPKKTDDINAYMRTWRAEHPDKVKQYTKKQSQSGKKKEYNKAYKEAHKEEIKAHNKHRYATMSIEQKMADCAKRKEKYWNNPEYRERIKTINRERARRKKAEKLAVAQSINIESGATAPKPAQDLPLS